MYSNLQYRARDNNTNPSIFIEIHHIYKFNLLLFNFGLLLQCKHVNEFESYYLNSYLNSECPSEEMCIRDRFKYEFK